MFGPPLPSPRGCSEINRECVDMNQANSNEPMIEAIGLSKSLTYLSLDRLRKAGRAKRCMAEDSNDLLWTVDTEKPCP